MTPHALLQELTTRGVMLRVTEAGRLAYDAPRGALTSELRAKLLAHKAKLLELIDRDEMSPRSPRRLISLCEEPAVIAAYREREQARRFAAAWRGNTPKPLQQRRPNA